MSDKETQQPREVFDLPENGFDILHDPPDDSPCDVRNGVCQNIHHLFPLAKPPKVTN